MFGDILGSVIGIAGDLFGFSKQADAQEDLARQQFEYNKELQQNNIDWQKEQLQNYHQWEMQDLKSAGINPILTASHGSSAVSVGQGTSSGGQAPSLSISKTLEAIANSALAKKETELKSYDAETNRIKANADMIRAEADKARTPSAIALAESQSGYYNSNAQYLDVKKELDRAMNEANIREIDQRIINATNEVLAKIELMRKQGDAALISANASQIMAHAQSVIADVAAKNGISQRALNDVLAGKADAETKEAYERAMKVHTDNQIAISHNPASQYEYDSPAYWLSKPLLGLGEVLRNGIGGNLP